MKRVAACLVGCAVLAGLTGCQSAGGGAGAAGGEAVGSAHRVIDARADEALRGMSQYLAGAQRLHFEADYILDAPDEGGQLLQFARHSSVDVERPNRIRGESKGDDWDKAYWYDGKTLTLLDRNSRTYSTVPTPDNIDAMLDHMHARYGLSIPTADLLFSDPYATLTQGVLGGRYIGRHEVLGRPCHHLAFTQDAVDWQIWIEDSATPVPRKLVVAYKMLAGVPRFSATFEKWDTQLSVTGDQFHFEPGPGMMQVEWEPVDAATTNSR